MAHIIISGYQGSLGQGISNYLLNHSPHTLTGFGRSPLNIPLKNQRCSYLTASLKSVTETWPVEFESAEVLIDLAWEHLNNYHHPSHLSEQMEQHAQFIEKGLKKGIRHVVVAGTCYEYGLQEGELFESMDCKPELPYARAKSKLLNHLTDLQKHYRFTLVWPRIFYLFGPLQGRKNLYSSLMESIVSKAASFNMSGGQQIRDFLFPEEMFEKFSQCSLQNHVTGPINICSGKPISLLNKIQNLLNEHNSSLQLNTGVFPYPDYEPMQCWGSLVKLKSALKAYSEFGLRLNLL